MKTESLIKALKKIGLDVVKEERTFWNYCTQKKEAGTPRYSVCTSAYQLSWYCSDGEAECVHVMRAEDEIDMRTDYTPGYFARTLKQVIATMSKK